MDVVHVPYRGSGPALQDLLSGQVVWMFETFSTTLQQHRAGKLRILAYAYSKRATIAPEIPTMIEAGVKGYEAYTFNLILGPAGKSRVVWDGRLAGCPGRFREAVADSGSCPRAKCGGVRKENRASSALCPEPYASQPKVRSPRKRSSQSVVRRPP